MSPTVRARRRRADEGDGSPRAGHRRLQAPARPGPAAGPGTTVGPRCDTDLALRPRRYVDGVWAPPVHLMRAQLTIVYLFAALGKLSLDFLSGNGLASWGIDSALAPRFLLVLPVLVTMAVGAVATELFVAVALWFRRTRPVAIVLGLLLHLCMIGWISDSLIAVVELTCFAATTTGGYLLFVDRLPRFVERRIPEAVRPRGGAT